MKHWTPKIVAALFFLLVIALVQHCNSQQRCQCAHNQIER